MENIRGLIVTAFRRRVYECGVLNIEKKMRNMVPLPSCGFECLLVDVFPFLPKKKDRFD